MSRIRRSILVLTSLLIGLAGCRGERPPVEPPTTENDALADQADPQELELGRWADPALAVKVVDVLIEYYYYGPRYDDLARSMSVNWADSGKRARFVALLAERQAQKDADPSYTHWSFHETFA